MSGIGKLGLKVDVPVQMKVEDPISGTVIRDADKKAAFIELLSTDSKVAQARRKAARKRLIEQVQKGKKMNYSVDQAEEDDIETLVSLTTGWYLIDPDTGEEIEDFPYSEDNARLLYSDNSTLWIREQVEKFVEDRSNFSSR